MMAEQSPLQLLIARWDLPWKDPDLGMSCPPPNPGVHQGNSQRTLLFL
jgi:hypothetical protein